MSNRVVWGTLAGDLDSAIEGYHRALALRPDDTFSSEMLSKALNEVCMCVQGAVEGSGSWLTLACAWCLQVFGTHGTFSVTDLDEELDAVTQQQTGGSGLGMTPGAGAQEPGNQNVDMGHTNFSHSSFQTDPSQSQVSAGHAHVHARVSGGTAVWVM